MTVITNKGRELAIDLNQGITREMLETCSLLCRAAKSYKRIQEDECNGHPANSNPHLPQESVGRLQDRWQARCEKRGAQLEAHINKLAGRLPGVKLVRFNGDPRACTVQLIMYNGRRTGWGEGVCVPGA